MYNALWIHSLPYSKFIELMLMIKTSRVSCQPGPCTIPEMVYVNGSRGSEIDFSLPASDKGR